MEFKGTKGKWSVGNNDSTCKTEKPMVRSDVGRMVCMLPPKSPETQANSLLISKAPEMLEMLIMIHRNVPLDNISRGKLEQLIKQATEI